MITINTPIAGTDRTRHTAMWVTRPCPYTCVGQQLVLTDGSVTPCWRCGA